MGRFRYGQNACDKSEQGPEVGRTYVGTAGVVKVV